MEPDESPTPSEEPEEPLPSRPVLILRASVLLLMMLVVGIALLLVLWMLAGAVLSLL